MWETFWEEFQSQQFKGYSNVWLWWETIFPDTKYLPYILLGPEDMAETKTRKSPHEYSILAEGDKNAR